MDIQRLILRIEWFGILFVVTGLYLQSFYDFVIRVIGAIMIIIGGSVLAFILGTKLGEGKDDYDKRHAKGTGIIGSDSWRDSFRKYTRMVDGRD